MVIEILRKRQMRKVAGILMQQVYDLARDRDGLPSVNWLATQKCRNRLFSNGFLQISGNNGGR